MARKGSLTNRNVPTTQSQYKRGAYAGHIARHMSPCEHDIR